MIDYANSRYRHLNLRGAVLALVLGFGVALGFPGAAYAQQICAADLNNNGDAADENTGNKRGHGSAGSTGLKMGQSC